MINADRIEKKLKRANSALPNLQSHPCFQSDLFGDNRAPGILKTWKEKHLKTYLNNLNEYSKSPSYQQQQQQQQRPQSYLNINENSRKFDIKDYQLENVIWSQTVIILLFHE
jgi:hypothetical protein